MLSTLLAMAISVTSPVTTSDIASLELVDNGFSSPLYVTAPEGDSRLFVVERGGRVRLVVDDQIVGTYLNVASLLPTSPGSEQGLLGMAFDPDFDANGRLYLSYTDSSGALIVTRLIVDPGANSVSIAGRDTILRIPQPAPNHNGGMILFGPDGYLYVGVGDGGGAGDPQGNGQNKNTLLGAILRLDVDGDDFPGDASRDYAIPAGNPFAGPTDGADEIWVYGLRNPWRFWIDHSTGTMYIADVGQSEREEVTILEQGAGGSNLGWDRLEGSRCYPSGGNCSTAGTILPQLEYSHGSGSASITGGMVYRGSRIPALYGTYFYADFIAGWVRSFGYNGSVVNQRDWSGAFNTSLVSSFGVDGEGEMYVVSLAGPVWRIVGEDNDEIFFYRKDGAFRYYDIRPDAQLGAPIRSGNGYSPNWDAITAVDLDGDGSDEMFFYKSPGIYAYYDIRPDASIGSPIRAGQGYSHKWDSTSSIDLDGDNQDEMFFYDRETGLYAFYNIRPDASLGAPLIYQEGYSTGWDTITAIDLDGDNQDEMLFYRQDGTFKYYRMRTDGSFHSLIAGGTGYSKDWSSITAIDLHGDRNDEVLFYRNDGTFKYYRTSNSGVGSLILAGTGYSNDWSSITSVDLD